MKKTICIHGHFYQPPRENPWLEYIELQTSAFPFHDWNEKITKECYLPNSASRLVNEENKIIDIVNNYSKISFNFGPTLLQWMKKFQKDAYEAIIKSDKKSVRQKNPAAIAQCYNHMIMPLANYQDKITQIQWGIKDFVYHFKRKPIGMWLPETAVDIPTLEALAKEKIKFTILAEHQVKEIKKISEDSFKNPDSNLSLNSPYLYKLPSGRSILIFIFNGEISFKISFSTLLSNGIDLAKTLIDKFNKNKNDFQFVNIATDGETFGHHKKFGDMALAACLRFLQNQNVNIYSYSKYFEESSVLYEIKINENTSWSCAHGIGRWKDDCSCNTGSYPNGNQKWRKFLRESLDFIRDELNKKYEEIFKNYNIDPWEIRNDYINVIIDRSKENVKEFLQRHINKKISNKEKINLLTSLEIQRHLMLMYTSCGWFFDDISNIETIQILRYAKRALQLAKDQALEQKFLSLLEKAQSNDKLIKNGKIAYEKFVNPSLLTLEDISAHFSIALLFLNIENITNLLSYEFSIKEFNRVIIEGNILLKGKITIFSLLTYEKKEFSFISLLLSPFIIFSYIENIENETEYLLFLKNVENLFYANKFLALNNLFLENKKNKNIYSFNEMFIDEKNKILQILLKNLFESFNDLMKKQLENKMQMFCEIKSQNILLPEMLNRSLDLYFYFEIHNLIQNNNFELSEYDKLINRAKLWNINFETEDIRIRAEKKLKELFLIWEKTPLNIHIMEKILNFLIIFIKNLNTKINLWHSQNILFDIKKEHKAIIDKITVKSKIIHKWNDLFFQIANILDVKFL